MGRRELVLITVAVEAALVLLAWGLGLALETPAFGGIRFHFPDVLRGVLGAVPLVGILLWTRRSRWHPLVRLRRTIDRVVSLLFTEATTLDLALVSAMAGFGEEVLFRGVAQPALAEHLGLGTALVVTSVLFGVAHALSRTYAVYATLIGLFLGALAIVFDNVLVPIVTHATYDFVALVILVRGLHGAPGDDEAMSTANGSG